jgi:hypothetical protein
VHVLHREVVATLVFADVEDLCDVHVCELPRDARLLEQLFDEPWVLREVAAEPLDDDEPLDAADRSLQAEMNLDRPLHPEFTEQYIPPERDRLAGSHGRSRSPGSRPEANKSSSCSKARIASIRNEKESVGCSRDHRG